MGGMVFMEGVIGSAGAAQAARAWLAQALFRQWRGK
jgi:hypothetical protein